MALKRLSTSRGFIWVEEYPLPVTPPTKKKKQKADEDGDKIQGGEQQQERVDGVEEDPEVS